MILFTMLIVALVVGCGGNKSTSKEEAPELPLADYCPVEYAHSYTAGGQLQTLQVVGCIDVVNGGFTEWQFCLSSWAQDEAACIERYNSKPPEDAEFIRRDGGVFSKNGAQVLSL
jgi:hypothetical protein